MTKDTVSIICPTYNEEKYITRTLNSFISQKLRDIDLEILIVDGRSQDATRSIVESFSNNDKRVRLIDNPERRTPFAFNRGLTEASGNYVAILGAHAEYDENYVQTCYDELNKSGSMGCTGKIIPRVDEATSEAKLCEWVMGSKFGVSGKSFRTIQEGYAHTINFPVYRKEILIKLGGYNTSLLRNQDNELNQRIVEAGGKLYVTWKTKCYYFVPSSFSSLFRYALKNGFWNSISLVKFSSSMKWYHFIPFLFVLSLIFSFGLSIIAIIKGSFLGVIPVLLILLIYFFLALIFAGHIAISRKKLLAIFLPFVFFIFHVSYGWGTLAGFFAQLKQSHKNKESELIIQAEKVEESV
jgi:glycosyltransferase involved in cell wall biosynthesis